jgi:two-component system, chemotaxis family, protein-glutamate methylesterase/glutaminase
MMTRVFVVDDSPFIRKALNRVLGLRPDFVLVGSAASGREALALIPITRPHVVTLDVEMPGMDGLTTLKELMRLHPGLPVVMMSAHTRHGANTTLDAMALGAMDFIDKSGLNVMDFERLSRELVGKLAACRSSARAFSWERPSPAPTTPAPSVPGPSVRPNPASLQRVDWRSYDLCVIGASTGGPAALQRIVESIPSGFPVPIAAVQHMPLGFTKPFADRLNQLADIRVREAREQDRLEVGVMLVARAGAHLNIGSDLSCSISLDPLEAKHTPSVDVLMASAARARGKRVVALLLTGMGDDGAEGMWLVQRAGGLTVAESEESCVVYGMPRAAHFRGGVSHLLSLSQICRLFAGS